MSSHNEYKEKYIAKNMKNINMSLRNCLIESYLLEDDLKEKVKKTVEALKNWLKGIKNKLKEMIGKVSSGITKIINAAKLSPSPEKVSEAKAEEIKKLKSRLDYVVKEYTNLLNDWNMSFVINNSKNLRGQAAENELLKEYVKKYAKYEEEARSIRRKLRNLGVDDFEKVNEENTSLGNRPKMILTMYNADRGEIFKTYKGLVSFIAKEIKNTIVSIGQNIKTCESIIKDQEREEMIETKNGKAKSKGLTLSQKFKVYSFVIKESFKRIGSNIKTFYIITGILYKVNILDGIEALMKKAVKTANV